MTTDDTYQRLATLVKARLASQSAVVPNLDDSFSAMGIDSLAMAELSLTVEKEFDIRLGEDVLDINTLGEMADYVDRLRKKKQTH